MTARSKAGAYSAALVPSCRRRLSSRRCASALQSWWCRCESSDEPKTWLAVSHSVATNSRLAIRNSWNGATYGRRSPSIHDDVSVPGCRSRRHAVLTVRASTLVTACATRSRTPASVSSRSGRGSSPQSAQNRVPSCRLHDGHVQGKRSSISDSHVGRRRLGRALWPRRRGASVSASAEPLADAAAERQQDRVELLAVVDRVDVRDAQVVVVALGGHHVEQRALAELL